MWKRTNFGMFFSQFCLYLAVCSIRYLWEFGFKQKVTSQVGWIFGHRTMNRSCCGVSPLMKLGKSRNNWRMREWVNSGGGGKRDLCNLIFNFYTTWSDREKYQMILLLKAKTWSHVFIYYLTQYPWIGRIYVFVIL